MTAVGIPQRRFVSSSRLVDSPPLRMSDVVPTGPLPAAVLQPAPVRITDDGIELGFRAAVPRPRYQRVRPLSQARCPRTAQWQVPAHAVVHRDVGYSRKSIRLLVFRSSSQVWSELKEKVFRWLTEVTRVVVLTINARA